MKVRVQRIGRSEYYNPHSIDDRLMEATIKHKPRPGEEMRIAFVRLGDGVWVTTKVVRIEYHGDTTLVHTKNSIYQFVKGWEDTDEDIQRPIQHNDKLRSRRKSQKQRRSQKESCRSDRRSGGGGKCLRNQATCSKQ